MQPPSSVVSLPGSGSMRVSSASAASTQNLGFFHGASNVDASRGMFNNVAGNQDVHNIHYHVHNHVPNWKLTENASFDPIPHAIGAGYASGNHKPCLKGTRTAILDEIGRWEADDTYNAVYWLKGFAGCGKSTIAQTFAERSAANGRLGASFFCSRDFDDRRDLHLIFPTLARDLAHRYPQFKAALDPIIRSNPDIKDYSLAVQLEKLLIWPLKPTRLSTTIVIDALDECEDKESVSEFLWALSQYVDQIPFVKIFITGRPEDHIRSGFAIPSLHTKEYPLHDVESSTVDSDIEFYLRTQLQQIAIRRGRSISGSWPSDKDIIAITRKASGLFIIASIIVTFIDYPYAMPQDRLKLIVNLPNSTIHEGLSGMDVVYHQVLLASFRDVHKNDSTPFDRFRLVLASIVLAFNPLSRSDLAKILGVSSETIWSILSHLHSVLVVPDSDSQPICICHKSFAYFLTDPQRCRDARFYVNAQIHPLGFSIRCFSLMNMTLKRNICRLPRFAMNGDIKDLATRRQEYVGAPLAYVCTFWADHLRSSAGAGDYAGTIVELVNEFFENQFLSWLEVLSVEGSLRVAVYSLHSVGCWLMDYVGPSSSLLNMIDDCERFVLQFFDVIDTSATHIYHSALPWSPLSSLTRKIYRNQMAAEVKLQSAINAEWDACIRTISIPHFLVTLAFSHNGASIAVISSGRVTIFEAIIGVATFEVHQSAYSVNFSPDDNMLVCGLMDGSARVWDVRTSDLIQEFAGHADTVHSVAFSPCGTMIASGGDDKTVRVWSVSSGRCKCVLEGHSDEVWTVCWSGTGDRVISGSEDATVRVWDVSRQTCTMILREHTERVTSVASFRGSFLAMSGSDDGTVKVYDSRCGDVLRTISTDDVVDSVQFSIYGDKILYTNGESASVWDLVGNMRVSTMKYEGCNAAISPGGTRVASGNDNFVKIWNIEKEYSNCETVNRHSKEVKAVCIAPDGHLMTSESYDLLKVWNMTMSQCLFSFDSDRFTGIMSTVFSPDSSFLACLLYNYKLYDEKKRQVRVWNVHTRSLVKVIDLDEQTDRVALSPGGSRLATLSSSHIALWDLGSGAQLAHLNFDSPFWWRSRIAFTVDGTGVFINSDGRTRCWRISLAQSSSDNNQLGSLPLAFLPRNEESIREDVSVSPRPFCRYKKHDEWILDQDGKRILWLPPDWRGWLTDFHCKKVAVGTESGRVYIADFSHALTASFLISNK